MVRIETIVICFKLRANFGFCGFLSFLGTYTHKVVKTWFVWHETWHTTRFYIYYCVKMVRIEKNCNMLDITCKGVFLRFF